MTLFRTIGAAVVVLSVGAGTGLAFLAGCAYQPDEAKTVAEPRALCGPSEEMAFGLVDKFESVPIGIGNAGGGSRFPADRSIGLAGDAGSRRQDGLRCFGGQAASEGAAMNAPGIFGAQAASGVHSSIHMSGHGYTIVKRTDVYAHQIVAQLVISGDGIRSSVVAEAVCRALDDELASRSQP